MYELWSDLPEACENTVEIADRVDIRIPEKIFHLPQYPVPQEHGAPERSDAEYLRELCETGLRERYGEERAAATPRCASGSSTSWASSPRWASLRTF